MGCRLFSIVDVCVDCSDGKVEGLKDDFEKRLEGIEEGRVIGRIHGCIDG